ncbi:MAG: TrkA C-terminal domain-containing protein [Ignavibacteria bacterium]|nr:TrkA C-terminal domain-containing protein [Ignavibacteria bacterium]
MQNYKNNKIRFEQIDLYDRYNNKKIKDLRIDELKNTIFTALKRNNKWLFNTDDDLQIESKDVLIIMTTP